MTDRRPAKLSDRQRQLIERAAAAVPYDRREEFVSRVVRHLAEGCTDDAVVRSINAQFDLLRATIA